MSTGRKSIAIALFLIAQTLAFSQTFRGGISGSVADQSGAAIAGCHVKLLSPDTGLTRNADTTSAGEFIFQDLPLGVYNITVANAGFQTQDVKDIHVEAGKIFNLKTTLSVASQATSVEVAANAVSVETSSSSLTSVIPTKAILDVPLNGRDFTQLLKLNPGVNAAGSVNGSRTNSINWQIDGADNNDQWHNSAAVNQGGVSGIAGTVLPIDAIDEFSLQTNGNAEQGRNGGGTLNLVIKSGTNNFHGSLYYFNRNEFLAARNWFTSPTAPTSELRNNQEGGSLGGPIWKNHTFFFATYEQAKYVAGGGGVQSTVPSDALVASTAALMRAKGFQVSPLAINLINALWPSDIHSAPGTLQNYTSAGNNLSNSYNGIIKLDHIFNERNNVAFRYFGGTGQQSQYAGSAVPYYYQVAPSRMHNFSAVYNLVISPRLVSQTMAGVNYFKQTFNDANTGFNMPALGLNTGVTNPTLFGSPDIAITDLDEIGLTPHLGRIDTTGHIDETLTYTVGTHSFRFGGEYRRARLDVFYDRNKRGSFTFDGSVTGISGLADFLAMQIPAYAASITYGDLQRNYYLNGTSFFAQDSWKATKNLTLNYGVNWQYQSPISDPTDRISVFDAAKGGITYVNQLGTLWPRDLNNFAPRFGFAYQPSFSSKLVLRGGYGIFYQVPNVNYFGDNRPPNHGATGILSNPGGTSPVYALSNQTPMTIVSGVSIFGSSAIPAGPYGAFSVSQHFRDAYTQNSNMNLQYQINSGTVLELGYTGSLSRKLPVTLDINQPMIGTGVRPYPISVYNLATINEVQSVGNGYYNGAIASLRTTGFHGLTTKLNYTYGHGRDDISSTRGATPQNSYDLRGNYGNADFDIRHSFVGYVSYQPPAPHYLKPLLGGWQFNTLLSFSTGAPFTVYLSNNNSGTGEYRDRAEVVGNPFANIPADGQPNYAYWMNPAAFGTVPKGTYSNQARNEFHGPPDYSTDFSVFKNTRINERFDTQLRMEIFNLFNNRDLGCLGTTYGGNLGKSTCSLDNSNGATGIGQGAPRNVQLALKLIF